MKIDRDNGARPVFVTSTVVVTMTVVVSVSVVETVSVIVISPGSELPLTITSTLSEALLLWISYTIISFKWIPDLIYKDRYNDC